MHFSQIIIYGLILKRLLWRYIYSILCDLESIANLWNGKNIVPKSLFGKRSSNCFKVQSFYLIRKKFIIYNDVSSSILEFYLCVISTVSIKDRAQYGNNNVLY